MVGMQRSNRLLGFLHAATWTFGLHGADFLTSLECLRKCIENNTICDEGPPASYMFEEIPDDSLDYVERLSLNYFSVNNHVLKALPLATLPDKRLVVRVLNRALPSHDACALKAIALLGNFAINMSNSIWDIHTICEAVMTMAAPPRDTPEYHEYALAIQADIAYVTFNESPLSIMTVVFWAARELNRRLMRWLTEGNAMNKMNYSLLYMKILCELGKKSTSVIYHLAASSIIGAFIGFDDIGIPSTIPNGIYEFTATQSERNWV